MFTILDHSSALEYNIIRRYTNIVNYIIIIIIIIIIILAWELIITSLLCHQLVRIVLTLSLSVHSLMLLHANGTN